MYSNHKDTLITSYFPRILAVVLLASISMLPVWAAQAPGGSSQDDIRIVEGEDRTVYEYRQNGILTMIKVVPDNGRAYYMVPADGAAHYEDLDHKRKLYPQWVIKEW